MLNSKKTKIKGPISKPNGPKALRPPTTPIKIIKGCMWPLSPKTLALITVSSNMLSIKKPKRPTKTAPSTSPVKYL